jgi:hypothetical protein
METTASFEARPAPLPYSTHSSPISSLAGDGRCSRCSFSIRASNRTIFWWASVGHCGSFVGGETARLDWSTSVTANASASPEVLERCCASNTIDSTEYGPVDNRLFNASKAPLLTWASLSCFIWLQMPGSNIHSGISRAGELFISSCLQRRTLLPPRRASPRTNAPCPNHGCQRYCTSRMQVLWVSCTPVVQHREATLLVRLQAAGTGCLANRKTTRGMEKWKANNPSHFSTPPTAAG